MFNILRPRRSTMYVRVRRSVTIVNPAKSPKPIEMSFRVGPRNHVLDGGANSPLERAILRGRRGPLQSLWILCSELCKNEWTDF